jgi:hypothetical protein
MKSKIYHLTFLILLAPFFCFGSAITPIPGNSTVCPDEANYYTINPGPQFSGCGTYTWTITNGTFNYGANPAVTIKTTSSATTTVAVYWLDV